MNGNTVLCGFVGSGKTTVGQILAQKSGRRLSGLDQCIEQWQRKTVSQIFANKGEQTFRRLETEAMRKLSSQKDLVIVTGGGTVLREESMDILCQNGVIVLLDASLDTLERHLDGAGDRPLLQRDDRQEFLCALCAKRMPLYRAVAQFCTDVDHGPDTVPEQILQKARLFFDENT